MLGRVAADLIEHRRHHDGLEQLNERLRLRTAELEASRDQLAAQASLLAERDQHREQFLAALGHELRNPLAAIQGGLALVTTSDERSRKALAVLTRQAGHMTRLTNDLLDTTRIRYGLLRIERTTMDLIPAVIAAVEAARPVAERKGLRIECETPSRPVAIAAAAERFAQILDNLLRNAISYTDAGTVSVRVTEDGVTARVAVRDTGIGIDPATSARLFEPYHRAAGEHGRDGLGLGLALVKALTDAHDGSIAVHSDGPGTGSEFTITMPLDGALAPWAASALASESPARRRMMVVDDQRDVADMLVSTLEGLGQDVFVAYDAVSALALAAERRPQVAFLDVAMPGTSGAELAQQLRELFALGELRLVAVTGFDKGRAQVQAGGFDTHILKPPTVEGLTAALNAVGGMGGKPSDGLASSRR